MTKKHAPDLPAPSSPIGGGGSVRVGDDVANTDCSLEAPKKPGSEAQIAVFEKARTKRAANRAASALTAPAAPATPLFCAEGDCPAPAAPAAPVAPAPAVPAAKTRKAGTNKGKKRGYLMRPEAAAKIHEAEE